MVGEKRHVLVSSGPLLTPEQWEVCGVGCYRACSNSLRELHQLSMAFWPRSESFYGDAAQVKVAARRDATAEETERLRQLAAQVFLLEEQRTEDTTRRCDDRSYVFLMYPPSVASTLNPDLYIVRVQFRALVVGLLVHQMLLHCIASVLLQDPESSFPSLFNVIPQSASSASPKTIVPGHLSYLSSHQVDIFISVLDLSYATALMFDSRPGLKFLVQKVANLPQLANLYRQAGIAWTIKIVILIELCLREIKDTESNVRTVKMILRSNIEDRECVKNAGLRKLSKYLILLEATFEELCKSYVEVLNGRYSSADRSDQEEQEEVENYNPYLDDECGLEELGPEIEDDLRPFRLSDLAVECFTDLGPQSEPETDDSRPVSRLGSVNGKSVYPDRSGGSSSEGYIDEKCNSITPAPLQLINNQDNLYYKLRSLRRTESADSFGTSRLETRIRTNGLIYDELCSFRRSRLERRRSDACLLTRKSSLRFVGPIEIDDPENRFRFNSRKLRCRSVIELRKTAGSTISNSSNDIEMSPRVPSKAEEKKENDSPKIIDNANELLRDYERSKRGFRMNPFLRKEEDESNPETHEVLPQDSAIQRKTNACKDKEARRKAWAEILCTVLDWTLALSDDQLSPLLPLFVSGVQVLNEHTVDQVLKEGLSNSFYRHTECSLLEKLLYMMEKYNTMSKY